MKLVVLDGNSIVNRAFFGVRPLNTADGTPTNAVFGFINILRRIISEEGPDALCVTFDLPAPTFRHRQYEGYKATRHKMPDELAVQMPILKETLDAMNIRRYELEGWEADDLLGTIAKKCASAGWECVVCTGDRDSLQLVSDATTVDLITTRMGNTSTKRVTPEVFRADYGFEPIHMIDLKALMGDSSDNIPGVRGAETVGPGQDRAVRGAPGTGGGHGAAGGRAVGAGGRAGAAGQPLFRRHQPGDGFHQPPLYGGPHAEHGG